MFNIFILEIKDFFPNFVAGILIYQKRNFKEGDNIKVQNIDGIISDISLIETKIITKDKDTIWIPNSMLIKNIVLND